MFLILLIIVLVIGGLSAYGAKKGTGTLVFIGILAVVLGMAVPQLASSLAETASLVQRPDTNANAGCWQMILYAVAVGIAVPLGTYLHRFFEWDLDIWESLGVMTVTMVLGFVLIRFFLSSLLISSEGLPNHAEMDQNFIVRQVVHLDGWNGFVDWMHGLGTTRPEPTVE